MHPRTYKAIWHAIQDDALHGCLVDCTKSELDQLAIPSFYAASSIADELRKYGHPVHHFTYNRFLFHGQKLKPFRYKDSPIEPNSQQGFTIARPDQEEWVYPKNTKDGFENPHARNILNDHYDGKRQAIVFGGFQINDCLKKTIIGAFKKASNPLALKIIFISDATTPMACKNTTYREIEEHLCETIASNIWQSFHMATSAEVIGLIRYAHSQPKPLSSDPLMRL